MSTWKAMGTGGRALILVLGAAATAAAGYLVWDGARPGAGGAPEAAAPANEPAAPAAAEAPAAEPSAEATAEEAPEVAPLSVLPPVVPVITTWAVTADGSCTVAGTGVPGATILVQVDGATVAETQVSSGGEFAVVTTLAANPAPSVMSLVMRLADGTEVPGAATVALGPIAGPPAPAEVAEEAPAEAEAPAAVMVTGEGATVLQDPAAEVAEAEPGAVAQVTVETITYTPAGAVQLGGSGEPGAFVRLYLDNAPLQEVLIPDSGKWLTTLKDVAPGVYTLRADQVDAAGKVTARFETPFKRETPRRWRRRWRERPGRRPRRWGPRGPARRRSRWHPAKGRRRPLRRRAPQRAPQRARLRPWRRLRPRLRWRL